MKVTKYARCGAKSCRKFWVIGKVSIVHCPTCVHVIVRCEECGGMDRAKMAMRGHRYWWATQGKGQGGHLVDVKTKGGSPAPADAAGTSTRAALVLRRVA